MLTGSAIVDFSDVRYFDSTSIGALIHHPNALFVLRNMNTRQGEAAAEPCGASPHEAGQEAPTSL